MNDIRKSNRRRGPDAMVKTIRIFSGISWLMVIVIFIMVTFAKPRVATMFDKYYNVAIGGQSWDKSMLGMAAMFLFLVTAICFIGIIINMNRHRRKTDRFSKSLIFFGIGSILGLVYYLLFL